MSVAIRTLYTSSKLQNNFNQSNNNVEDTDTDDDNDMIICTTPLCSDNEDDRDHEMYQTLIPGAASRSYLPFPNNNDLTKNDENNEENIQKPDNVNKFESFPNSFNFENIMTQKTDIFASNIQNYSGFKLISSLHYSQNKAILNKEKSKFYSEGNIKPTNGNTSNYYDELEGDSNTTLTQEIDDNFNCNMNNKPNQCITLMGNGRFSENDDEDEDEDEDEVEENYEYILDDDSLDIYGNDNINITLMGNTDSNSNDSNDFNHFNRFNPVITLMGNTTNNIENTESINEDNGENIINNKKEEHQQRGILIMNTDYGKKIVFNDNNM